jgi:adenylate kinase family enzyme
VKRVSVVGTSGSGKTRLAAGLARRLCAPHVELDAIFHQPGWQPLPKAVFLARVAEITAGGTWVIDGNYAPVRDLVWQRADTVVWLDLPRRVVMRRIIWRTLSRAVLRAELWNGNREPWSNFFSADPEKSVIAYAWAHYRADRAQYASAAADPANAHLTFVRLCTDQEVAAFLAAGAGTGPRAGGAG